MSASTVRTPSVTAVLVRMLPAIGITVGLLGLAAATTTLGAVGGGVLVGCAVVLELGGWAGAARTHATALGTAALMGALLGALGLGAISMLDGTGKTRPGLARR